MSTIRNLRVKSLDSIGQYGALELRRVFPLSCSNDTLIEVFTDSCIHNGFIVTERTGEKATAVKESINMFQCVVPGFPLQPSNSSARDIVVNLTITVNLKHDYKLLTVVGPKRPTMQSFLHSFEQSLGSVSHFWVSRFSDTVRKDFRLSFHDEGIGGSSSPVFQSMAETGNQSFKTEEAAYYYFYKILSNRTYSLGSDLGKFISEFHSSFPLTKQGDLSPQSDEQLSALSSTTSLVRDAALSDLSVYDVPPWSAEESSRKILKEIDNIVSKFDSNYLSLRNPSATLVDDLLPRLRPSVERYVFESVGRRIWLHYRKSFTDEDKSFSMKAIAIRGAHGDSLGEACGVRNEFRFRFDRSIALMNDLQRSFDSSAVVVPNTFVQRLLSILVSVKTEVLTGTLGQRELESMDDIAPIFLFVLISAADVKSPNALYHFLQDTMRPDQRLETEGRAVALLEGASRLIMNDWTPSTNNHLLVDL